MLFDLFIVPPVWLPLLLLKHLVPSELALLQDTLRTADVSSISPEPSVVKLLWLYIILGL
jgi:hypothetical protein